MAQILPVVPSNGACPISTDSTTTTDLITVLSNFEIFTIGECFVRWLEHPTSDLRWLDDDDAEWPPADLEETQNNLQEGEYFCNTLNDLISGLEFEEAALLSVTEDYFKKSLQPSAYFLQWLEPLNV